MSRDITDLEFDDYWKRERAFIGFREPKYPYHEFGQLSSEHKDRSSLSVVGLIPNIIVEESLAVGNNHFSGSLRSTVLFLLRPLTV